MALCIRWGNRLESLADDLFARLLADKAQTPAEVFERRDCIVVPNRIQQAWLQQRFLYDLDRRGVPVPHVLANCDFPLLPLFIHDWLHRMDHPEVGAARPNPEEHPFSVKSLRWRIFAFLCAGNQDEVFEPLRRYVMAQEGARPDLRKGFKLAGRLAKLLDEYVTYRPQMVIDWEAGRPTGTDEATAWQPALWRILTEGQRAQTVLSALRRMERDLHRCGIGKVYRRVFVFAPSMMPGTHLAFFRALGGLDGLDVGFYLLNPSHVDWFDRESLQAAQRNGFSLERSGEGSAGADFRHPLLSAFARGSRDLVIQAVELGDSQLGGSESEQREGFVLPGEDTLLAALQRSIAECDGSLETEARPCDGSIQIHLCHGKMREVEILRDQLLRCFAEMPGLQPRHIQVQAADLNAYAPYIEAVFSTPDPRADRALPFVIADRVAGGESPAAEAFRRLLDLPESRFAAPDLVDVLRCECLARRFGLKPDDVDTLADWLDQAGVRWGRDQSHRASLTGADFEEQTTWRHGLDRLLLGYALGRDATGPEAILPCDCVEGDGAVLLGRLVRFYDEARAFADFGSKDHPAPEWADRLDRLIGDFFISDNDTFLDIALLKGAVRLLRTSLDAAGFTGAISMAVVRDFVSGHLGETTGGTDLSRNAVVFCSLRPGSSTPRPIQCLLGMGDSLFPRTEGRPAYDLLRSSGPADAQRGGPRRLGDRSPTIEDRMAFLETLLNARARLLISYPAFSEEDNEPAGVSVAVRELTDYLDARFGPASTLRIRHRLHGFHPAYFGGDPRRHPNLFSYSDGDRAAAEAWLGSSAHEPAPSPAPEMDCSSAERRPPSKPIQVALEDLIRFFKNPAQFHYERVLGVRLETRGMAALADSETFSPNPLEQFQIRDRILKASLDRVTPEILETVRTELTSAGLAPLGDWGRRWFEEAGANIQALLDSQWERMGRLRDVLQARQNAAPRSVAVALTVKGLPVTLTGEIPVTDLSTEDGAHRPLAFTFRCASPKANVMLGAWLQHVLLCAEQPDSVSIVAQGSRSQDIDKENQVAVYNFGGFSIEGDGRSPAQLLEDCLEVYLDGHRAIPPFTPDSSMAYAKVLHKYEAEPGKPAARGAKSQPPLDADALRAKALEEAVKVWIPAHDPAIRHGADDAYFRAAFGEAGPFADPDAFGRLAEQILMPMLNLRERLKPSRETA